MEVAIIGAGSFGTVLADIAAHNGCKVRIYARREEMVHAINAFHRNPQYHPDLELHGHHRRPSSKASQSSTEKEIFAT